MLYRSKFIIVGVQIDYEAMSQCALLFLAQLMYVVQIYKDNGASCYTAASQQRTDTVT